MRILIVSEDIPYPNMGGLAKQALKLARALLRAGHEVDILGGDQHPIDVAGEEGNFGGRFFGGLNGHMAGWKESRLGMYLPPKRTWLARRFARIILRHAPGYDAVHYHGHVPNLARFLPEDLNFVQTRHDQGSDCLAHVRFRDGEICASTDPAECASCITPHPNALQRAVSTRAVIRFRREVAESFRRHKTVFVSDMLQRNFARSMGPGPWGATVHNFVDVASLKQARESAKSLAASGGFTIFFAGKLYPAKGIELFLRELVPHLRPDMRVTVAGDGPAEAQLRAEFEDERIRFLGWCTPEKTLRMAAASNAVVVPSILEEAFGVSTLEGLLLGKPTFALARGATPELSIYAASPEQLRLHADMRSLVKDLVSFEPRRDYGPAQDELAGADRAVRQLLHIYRLPPGAFSQLTG
jgi:glycosyltransferase involved in cell wall biosynthesis